MPYRYLEDIALADVAFEAWGDTVEEMFVAASDATMNVMVGDLATISQKVARPIQVEAESIEMLLFHFLQELIYYKDAERLLLRIPTVDIRKTNDHFMLSTEARGEELDPQKHELIVDVKAVTLHRYSVEKAPTGWEARVILDI
jgi:SHS2 domain-containing protein